MKEKYTQKRKAEYNLQEVDDWRRHLGFAVYGGGGGGIRFFIAVIVVVVVVAGGGSYEDGPDGHRVTAVLHNSAVIALAPLSSSGGFFITCHLSLSLYGSASKFESQRQTQPS